LFCALKATGISYRRIAALAGMSQSEVSEIISGRRVLAYNLLVRIAEGLGIPRELMGLSYGDGPKSAYDNEGEPAPEVDEVVQRRRFLNAVMGIVVPAVFHHVVPAELLTPMDPLRPAVPTPLPSRLGMSDVDALRTLTERMRALARYYGGQAETISAVAHRSTRLMGVTSDEQVKADLGSALAELHSVAAWCCFDSGADDAARAHFTRSVEFAHDAGDAYSHAYTLWLASSLPGERGYPDDALTLLQMGQIVLAPVAGEPRVAFLAGWLRAEAAYELSRLGRADRARSEMAAARDGWEPPDADEAADMDATLAELELNLGRLDVAESAAAAAMRGWEGNPDRRRSVLGAITLATIHVRAGEPRGLVMAKSAIDAVALLRSGRARDRLVPLAAALEARLGSDYRELARMTRQVATTRA